MTSDVMPVGDPRRLLADARDLARRVRVAQRVTWLPLLVLALVVFGAIPVYGYGRRTVSDCQALEHGEVCKVLVAPVVPFYWPAVLVLAYVVIAGGYLWVARARGVDARVLPYVVTGAVLIVLFGAVRPAWLLPDRQAIDTPSTFVQLVFRLIAPAGAIGLALLVLSWLERHVALLVFTLGYLVVVLLPPDIVWGAHWGGRWEFAPRQLIDGGVLLLGSAGFALAQRLRRRG